MYVITRLIIYKNNSAQLCVCRPCTAENRFPVCLSLFLFDFAVRLIRLSKLSATLTLLHIIE